MRIEVDETTTIEIAEGAIKIYVTADMPHTKKVTDPETKLITAVDVIDQESAAATLYSGNINALNVWAVWGKKHIADAKEKQRLDAVGLVKGPEKTTAGDSTPVKSSK